MAPVRSPAAAVLLAACLLLAAASALSPAPAPAPCPAGLLQGLVQSIRMEAYDYEKVMAGLESLSVLDAAQCVCDALKASGLGGVTPSGLTSEVEVILKRGFAVLPMSDQLPQGFTCTPDAWQACLHAFDRV